MFNHLLIDFMLGELELKYKKMDKPNNCNLSLWYQSEKPWLLPKEVYG